MVQDPFKVDQVRIQPDSALPILLYASGGDLTFKDGTVTGGLKVKDLAGLALNNLLTVGVGGVGAKYTSIQSALDDVPASSSMTNPHVILVGPGVYQETVNVVRDGVFILGNGAILQSAAEATPNGVGAYHTMVIQSGLGTHPQNVFVRGLRITNAHDSYACVRVSGGSGSLVGQGGVHLLDCEIQAVAAGGNRPVWATSVNNIFVRGGSMASSALALVFAQECARVVLDNVRDIPAFQLDYDSGGTLPAIVTSAYQVTGCLGLGATSTLPSPLNAVLSGGGSLEISGCTGGADLTMGGNRTLTVRGSALGDLVLGGTTAARLVGSSRGTVTGATATLAEPIQSGSVSFVAVSSVAVPFSVPHPDTDYHITPTLVGAAPAGQEVPYVTAKTVSGFTLNFTSPQTLTVEWSVSRAV